VGRLSHLLLLDIIMYYLLAFSCYLIREMFTSKTFCLQVFGYTIIHHNWRIKECGFTYMFTQTKNWYDFCCQSDLI
jgi:hypothetical protein